MPIDDPTALPEDAQQTAEYIREADLAFDRQQLDLALSLYWSASAAALFDSDASRTHTYLRVGTILMGQDNDTEAYRWLEAAGPAGADLLKVLDAKTPDAAVDPNVVPETPEMLMRYVNAVTAANATKDYATFDQLVARVLESGVAMPGQRSEIALLMGQSLFDRGFADQAEEWAEHSLAQSSGANADEARALIAKIRDSKLTSGAEDQRVITYGFELTAGIESFEAGAGDKGRAMFERVIADTSGLNDDQAKGRARYYLGVIAYQEHHFDVAREHFEFAVDNAAAPELGFAAEALRWRYQEEG